MEAVTATEAGSAPTAARRRPATPAGTNTATTTVLDTTDVTHPARTEQTLSPSDVRSSAAASTAPLLHALFPHGLPLRFTFWDGSAVGPDDGPGRLHVLSARAVTRLLWSPGELGLARAFVSGEIDFEGDTIAILRALQTAAPPTVRVGARMPLLAFRAAHHLGAIGLPPARPAEEAPAPRGRRHSPRRDAKAVQHHYDVGNDFYRLVLGPSMTYSCARFVHPASGLDEAQEAKADLVCRKLGLHERPGQRLLDVGCGWGSLAMHAAKHYDATVVGVTLSAAQVELARRRVEQAELADRVEVRLQDYRDLRGEQFDVISSIGMFEHVGAERMAGYFTTLRSLLPEQGRLLNHAISRVGSSRMARRSFIGRYVFPDGELIDVGQVVLAMERAGFEVRDVESLREHYARTLQAWVANLTAHWDAAVAAVGVRRARVWLLYMAASANGFAGGAISIHQVLGVVAGPTGTSSMPATRRSWD